MDPYSKIHQKQNHGRAHGWKAMAKFLCLMVWLTWPPPASSRPVPVPVDCKDYVAWTRKNLLDCLDLKCEYRCLINVTGPECVCPPHSFLGPDNRTCQDISTSISDVMAISTPSWGISLPPSESPYSSAEKVPATLSTLAVDTQSDVPKTSLHTDMAPHYPPSSISSVTSAITDQELTISSMFTQDILRPVTESSSKLSEVVDEVLTTSPSISHEVQTSSDHVTVTPVTRFGETSMGFPFGTTKSIQIMPFTVSDHQSRFFPSEIGSYSPGGHATETTTQEVQSSTSPYASSKPDTGIGTTLSMKEDSTRQLFSKPGGEVAESTIAFQDYSSEVSLGSTLSSPSFVVMQTDFIRPVSTEAATDSAISSLPVDIAPTPQSLQSSVASSITSQSYTADLVSPSLLDFSSVLTSSGSAKVDIASPDVTVVLATPPLRSTIDTATTMSKVHFDGIVSSTEATSSATTQGLSTEGVTTFSLSVTETVTPKLYIPENFTATVSEETFTKSHIDSATVGLTSASVTSVGAVSSSLLDVFSIFPSRETTSDYLDSAQTVESAMLTLSKSSLSTEVAGFITSSSTKSESPQVDSLTSPSPVVPYLPATAESSELQTSSDLLSFFPQTGIYGSYDTASVASVSASPLLEPPERTEVQSLPIATRYETSALLSSAGVELPVTVSHTLSDVYSMGLYTDLISVTLDELTTMPLGDFASDLSSLPIPSGSSKIQPPVLTGTADLTPTSAVTSQSGLSLDTSPASKVSFSAEAEPLTTGDLTVSPSTTLLSFIPPSRVRETSADSSATIQLVDQVATILSSITATVSEEVQVQTTSLDVLTGQTSPLPSGTLNKSIDLAESSGSFGESTTVSVAATRITFSVVEGFGSSIPRNASDVAFAISPSFTMSEETSVSETSITQPYSSLEYSSSIERVEMSTGHLQSDFILLETSSALRIPTSVTVGMALSSNFVVKESTETTTRVTTVASLDGLTTGTLSENATRSEESSSVRSDFEVHTTPTVSQTVSTFQGDSFKTYLTSAASDTDLLTMSLMSTPATYKGSFTRTLGTDFMFPESSADITMEPSKITSSLFLHADVSTSGVPSESAETTQATRLLASFVTSSAGATVLSSRSSEEVNSSGTTVTDRSSIFSSGHPSLVTVPLHPSAAETLTETTTQIAGLTTTAEQTTAPEQTIIISSLSAEASFTNEVSSMGAAETEYVLSTISSVAAFGSTSITIMPTGTDRSILDKDSTTNIVERSVSDYMSTVGRTLKSESTTTITPEPSQRYLTVTESALSTSPGTGTVDSSTLNVSALVSSSTQTSELKSVVMGTPMSTSISQLSLPVSPTEAVTLQTTDGFTNVSESVYETQPSVSVAISESLASASRLIGEDASISVSVRHSSADSSVSVFTSPSTVSTVTASESILEIQPSGVTTSASSLAVYSSTPHQSSMFTAMESGGMPFSPAVSLDILSSVSPTPGFPSFLITGTLATDSELSDLGTSFPRFPAGSSIFMKSEEPISASGTFFYTLPSTVDTSEELLTSFHTSESKTTESESSMRVQQSTSESSGYTSLETRLGATAVTTSVALESTSNIQSAIPVFSTFLLTSMKVDEDVGTSAASFTLEATPDYSDILPPQKTVTTVIASTFIPDIRPASSGVSSLYTESSFTSESLDSLLSSSSSEIHLPAVTTRPLVLDTQSQFSFPHSSATESVSSSIETEITAATSASPVSSISDSSSRTTRPEIEATVSASGIPSSTPDFAPSTATSLSIGDLTSRVRSVTPYISHLLTSAFTEAVTPEFESTGMISSPALPAVGSSMHTVGAATSSQFFSDTSAVFGGSFAGLSSQSTPDVQYSTLGFSSGLLTFPIVSGSQLPSDVVQPTADLASSEMPTASGTASEAMSSSRSDTTVVFSSYTSSTQDFANPSVSEPYVGSSFTETLPTTGLSPSRSSDLMTSSATAGLTDTLTMSTVSHTPPATRLYDSSTLPVTSMHVRPTPSTPRIDDSLMSTDSLVGIVENVASSASEATEKTSLGFTALADFTTYAVTPADSQSQIVSSSFAESVQQPSSSPSSVFETSAPLSSLFGSLGLTTVEEKASFMSPIMPSLSSGMTSERYVQTMTSYGSGDFVFASVSFTSGMSSLLDTFSSQATERVVNTLTSSERLESSSIATTSGAAGTDQRTSTSTLPSFEVSTVQVSGVMESSAATGIVHQSMLSGFPTSTAGVTASESSYFISTQKQFVSVTKSERMEVSTNVIIMSAATREMPTLASSLSLDAESTSEVQGVSTTTLGSPETQSLMSSIEIQIATVSSFARLSTSVFMGPVLPSEDVRSMSISGTVASFALTLDGSTSTIVPTSSLFTKSGYEFLSSYITSSELYHMTTSTAYEQVTSFLEPSSSLHHISPISLSASERATATDEYLETNVLSSDLEPSLIDSAISLVIPASSLKYPITLSASTSLTGETTQGTKDDSSSRYTFKPSTTFIVPTTVSIAKESELVTVVTFSSADKASPSTQAMTLSSSPFTKGPATDSTTELEKTSRSSVFVTDEFAKLSTESTRQAEMTESPITPVLTSGAMPVTSPVTKVSVVEETKVDTKPTEKTTKPTTDQMTPLLEVSTNPPASFTPVTMTDSTTDVPLMTTVKDEVTNEITKTTLVTEETLIGETKVDTKPTEKTTKPAVDQTTFSWDVSTKPLPFSDLATKVEYKTDSVTKTIVKETMKDEVTNEMTKTMLVTEKTLIGETKVDTKPTEKTTKPAVDQTTFSWDMGTKPLPFSDLATKMEYKTDSVTKTIVKETMKDEVTNEMTKTMLVTEKTLIGETKVDTKPTEKTTKPAVDQTTLSWDVTTKPLPFSDLATKIEYKTDSATETIVKETIKDKVTKPPKLTSVLETQTVPSEILIAETKEATKPVVKTTQLPPEELKAMSHSPDETFDSSTQKSPSSKDVTVTKESTTKFPFTVTMASTFLSFTASSSQDLTTFTSAEMTRQSMGPSMTEMPSTVEPQYTSKETSSTMPTSMPLTDSTTIVPTPTTTGLPLPVVSNTSTLSGPSTLNQTSGTIPLEPSAAESASLPSTSVSPDTPSTDKPANLTLGETSTLFNETVFISRGESLITTVATTVVTKDISSVTEHAATSASVSRPSTNIRLSQAPSSTTDHSVAWITLAGSTAAATASTESDAAISSAPTAHSDVLGSTTRIDASASVSGIISRITLPSTSPADVTLGQLSTPVPPVTSEMLTTVLDGAPTMRSTIATPAQHSTTTDRTTSLTASGTATGPEITTTQPSSPISNQTAHEVRATSASSASEATSFARPTISSMPPESQSSSFSIAETSSTQLSTSAAPSPVMTLTPETGTSEALPPAPHATTLYIPAPTLPLTSSTSLPGTTVPFEPSMPTPPTATPLTSEHATSEFPLTQPVTTTPTAMSTAHSYVTTFSDIAKSTSAASLSTGTAATTSPEIARSTESTLPSVTVLMTKSETVTPTTSRIDEAASPVTTTIPATRVPAPTASEAEVSASTTLSSTATVTAMNNTSTASSPSPLRATTVSTTMTPNATVSITSEPSTAVLTFSTATSAPPDTKVPLTSAAEASSEGSSTPSTLPTPKASFLPLTSQGATTEFSTLQAEKSTLTSSATLPTTTTMDLATPVTTQQLTTESAVPLTKAPETTAVVVSKTPISGTSATSDSTKTSSPITATSTMENILPVTMSTIPSQTSASLTTTVVSKEPATAVSTTTPTSKVVLETSESVPPQISTLEPATKIPGTGSTSALSTTTPVPPDEAIHATLVMEGPTSDSLFNITSKENANFKNGAEKTLQEKLTPNPVIVLSLKPGSVRVYFAVLYWDTDQAGVVRQGIRQTLEKIQGTALPVNGVDYRVRDVIVEHDLITVTPATAQSLTLPLGVGLGVPLVFLLVLGLVITAFCLVRATHRQPVEENDPWKLRAAFGRRSPSISARGSRRSFTSDMSNRLMSSRYSRHWEALAENDHHGLPRPTLAEAEQGKAGRRPSNAYLQGVFPYNGDAAHTERSGKSKDSDQKQIRETTYSAFSWEMLMQYIDPNEEFRVQRPTVESTPSELYTSKKRMN